MYDDKTLAMGYDAPAPGIREIHRTHQSCRDTTSHGPTFAYPVWARAG